MAFDQIVDGTRNRTAHLVTLVRFGFAACARSASVFFRDLGHGLLEVCHNSFALLGLMLAAVLLFAAGRAELRHDAEVWALGWLQEREEARAEPVDALAAQGLVTRLPDPKDARGKIVVLSAAGKHLLTEANAVKLAIEAEYRAALGAASFAALQQALAELARQR